MHQSDLMARINVDTITALLIVIYRLFDIPQEQPIEETRGSEEQNAQEKPPARG